MTTETTEKTFTVTLTENEAARILDALDQSAESLRTTAAEKGDVEGAYPTMLAEAAEQLAEKIRNVMQPDRHDPNRYVHPDERLRLEQLADL